MWYYLICKYCDYKTVVFIADDSNKLGKKCIKCRSTDVKITTKDTSGKIDTYAGAPAFEDDDDPYDDGWNSL